jgi:hypothetical protein
VVQVRAPHQLLCGVQVFLSYAGHYAQLPAPFSFQAREELRQLGGFHGAEVTVEPGSACESPQQLPGTLGACQLEESFVAVQSLSIDQKASLVIKIRGRKSYMHSLSTND